MDRNVVLCTVGTSLLNPASAGGRHTAGGATDWRAVAEELARLPLADRACGAEANSLAALVAAGVVTNNCAVELFHSDTTDGRAIAAALGALFRSRGHAASVVPVAGLRDDDPSAFATEGLPNLARALAASVRRHGAGACCVNATGGFKGQAAVAVQAAALLGVPAYYLHERFAVPVLLPALALGDLQ
jgi:putative CRISPR-associated protein (TIGR02619 family)